MKQGIHPQWFDCQVTCSCGNTFVTGSIQESMQVDICDKCHPFFTGEVKFVDRQGRVDRFLNKMKAAENSKQTQTKKQAKLAKQQGDTAPQAEPQSYRDLLRDQQTSLRKSSKTAESN
ncbi:MAG: large subunit ribosomal protein [Patescibacteria group bacterium]|nr:large subunit ribosomal protein [Patescibacteria group bacterium]